MHNSRRILHLAIPLFAKNSWQLRGQELIEHRCEVNESGTCSGPARTSPATPVCMSSTHVHVTARGEDVTGLLKALISPSQLLREFLAATVPGKLPLSAMSPPSNSKRDSLPSFVPCRGRKPSS